MHYEVSKTSTTTLSGQEGPYSSQAEADAAAEAAKSAAISQLQAEAQSMVDAAIAAARAELATIRFSYDEVEIRMASRNSMAVLAATRPSLCLPTAPTTTS